MVSLDKKTLSMSRVIFIFFPLILLLLAVAWLAFRLPPSAQDLYLKGDLNSNGIQEEYMLTNHKLLVSEGASQLWYSPKEYHIDSFSLGDVNNDGTINLVISLWKRGSFGEMKPFWHTKKDNDYKNHLFVYKLQDNALTQVWCSSNLDRPILSFEIKDFDGDKLNDLVVTEGQYKKIFGSKYAHDFTAQQRTAVWEWQEWGFQLKATAPEI